MPTAPWSVQAAAGPSSYLVSIQGRVQSRRHLDSGDGVRLTAKAGRLKRCSTLGYVLFLALLNSALKQCEVRQNSLVALPKSNIPFFTLGREGDGGVGPENQILSSLQSEARCMDLPSKCLLFRREGVQGQW